MRKIYVFLTALIVSAFGFNASAQDEAPKGTVTIDGQFYTFVAQAVDDNRNEPFAFTNTTYFMEKREFTFTPDVVYTLKGQNESNSFFVYLNGVEVANQAEEGQTGYVANVTFQDGDVVEIYQNTPYVATVTIDGQFYTFAAQDQNDNRNEAFAFTYNTYVDQTSEFTFAPGVTYDLKGQNESNSFYVYINGVQVLNQAEEGQTGYFASVQFHSGDVVEILESTPYLASVTINGQFYTFSAQAGDDNRDEPFAFTYGTYENQTQQFSFNPAVTYTLKGQNETNTFFVYINGVLIPNEAGEGETGYVANVQFNVNDVVQIYQASPYVGTVTINGEFYIFTAQAGDDNRDEPFSFSYATYENQTQEFTFNPGVSYTLKGQNPSNTFTVTINGVEIPNEADVDEQGYRAVVTFNSGDVVSISNPTSSINSIVSDELNNGKVYNMQGIEVNKNNLTPGIYVVNGKKTVIR